MGRTKRLDDSDVAALFGTYLPLIVGMPRSAKPLALQYAGDKASVRYRKYCNSYPSLGLNLTATDVTALTAFFPAASPVPGTRAVAGTIKTPFEKLLYALAWKNADVPKLQKLIAGTNDALAGKVSYPRVGVVFYQFGRHLADRNHEPIIDQHTIRAFKILGHMTAGTAWIPERKKANVTADDVLQYRTWIAPLAGTVGSRLRLIDQVMFFLGKASKG